MFAQDIVLTLISIIGVVGLFMLSFYLDKLFFHRSTHQAAVCALIAGSPTIGFLGFAVLDPIYGNTVTTNLVIGIVSIVVNAITIPLGLALINRGQDITKKKAQATNTPGTKIKVEQVTGKGIHKATRKVMVTIPDGVPVTDAEARALEEKGLDREIDLARAEIANHANTNHKPMNSTLKSILNAIKQPVAAAPLLAVIFVLVGIHIPSSWAPTFDLIAKANAGVAVLAAGLALATVKFSVDREVI